MPTATPLPSVIRTDRSEGDRDVHSSGARGPSIYRTGSPRDYLLGAALLGVAAWFAWEFIRAAHIHEIDRPILAIISVLLFGGMGVFVILRGGVRAVVLDGDRLCVRDWAWTSRCFPLERLARVTWSYRYAGGLWGHYDQGRAWVEFEFTEVSGERTRAVVDYAGRARHAEIERLTHDLADRAGLSWDSKSDPMDATDLPSAEVIWTRRRGARDADR